MHSGFLKWFDPKLEIYVHRSLINCLAPDPDYKQLIQTHGFDVNRQTLYSRL